MARKLNEVQLMTAVLSYLGILWLVPFIIVRKRDDFDKFHISQGINLFIMEIIVLGVLSALSKIPWVGVVFQVLFGICTAFFIIVIIIAIVRAVQGEKWKIPIISGARFVNLK